MPLNTPAADSAGGDAAARRPSKMTLRDFVIIAFYYRRMVASILVGALALAVLGWMVSPVRYTAQLQLMLLSGTDSANPLGGALPGGLSANPARDVSSEVEFLRNRSLLAEVAQKIGPARLNPRLGERRLLGLLPPIEEKEQINNAVEIIERYLKVSTATDSNMLVVTFQHVDRATAIALTDTLADLYLQRRADLYNNLRSPFLMQKAQAAAKQLQAIEEQIRLEKEKSNVLDLPQEILLALNQVDAGIQRRHTLLERHTGLLAEVEASRARIGDLPSTVFDFEEKTDRVDNDDTDNLLVKLYLERDRLAALYQSDDPRIDDINRQIGTLDQVKKTPRRIFIVHRTVRNPSLDFLSNHLQQVQVEADAVAKSITELDQQVSASQERVNQLRNSENSLHALERSRGITEQLYRDFTQRAEQAQVEEAAAALKTSNIRIVAPADASFEGTSAGLNLALALLATGILIAIGAALMADWNRQVFLLPNEIEDTLDLPVLATFNEGQDLLGKGNIGQVIFLAGQLGFNRSQSGDLQKLQVVSQGRHEYRQEFTRALAMELASGQNMRTLLLDLVEDGNGHWQALKQPAPTRTVAGFRLAPSGVPLLDVSSGAPRSEINWLRANKETLTTLFAELNQGYDMIVIDAPPFRDGTESVRLANIVDGTILVLCAEHTRRSGIEYLLSQLIGSGGDLYGAVFTGRKFYIPRAIYRWL